MEPQTQSAVLPVQELPQTCEGLTARQQPPKGWQLLQKAKSNSVILLLLYGAVFSNVHSM